MKRICYLKKYNIKNYSSMYIYIYIQNIGKMLLSCLPNDRFMAIHTLTHILYVEKTNRFIKMLFQSYLRI